MKQARIWYGVCTILFAAFMIWTGIPGIKPNEDSLKFMRDLLGYPVYFIQFISVAKILGSIAIMVPGFNRIKEWAYAGLFFDLIGAFYSITAAAGKFEPSSLFILLPLLLGAVSYYLWKKQTAGAIR